MKISAGATKVNHYKLDRINRILQDGRMPLLLRMSKNRSHRLRRE